MATVFEVAEYILLKQGEMTAMKLEKLVYYSQAWSLVWDEKALFDARIEAWANGPVVPQLYFSHRGAFKVDERLFQQANVGNLTEDEIETIDVVLETYGGKTPSWLSELTHREAPWKDAREGLRLGERGNNEITHSSMAEYYESLL